MAPDKDSEDTMSDDDKKRFAVQFYMRASQAEQKQNWEYAAEMWRNATKLDPDNEKFRGGLRFAQRKSLMDDKSKAKSGMKLRGIKGKVKKALAKEEWKEADHLAEEGLMMNPWDAQLLADVGRACAERGFLKMACMNYKWAVMEDKENKALLKTFAIALEAMAAYDEATNVWDRIYKLDPMDSEARSKITSLGALKMMDRGGVEDAESTLDVKQGTSAYDDFDPGVQRAKQEVVGPGQSAEADLQRAIRKNPEKPDSYVQLGELYRKQKNYSQAIEILQQAVDVSGGDPNIREILEDVEIDSLKQNYEIAKKTASQEPDDTVHQENLKALQQELLKRQLQVLFSRVERYPKDTRLRLELGKTLYNVKQFEKAIPHLQRASGDQRLVADVNVLLGKCFYQVKKHTLAIGSLKKAATAINPIDQTDLFCETHYLLGYLFEMQKDYPAAEEHFQEVIGVNYEYRDALDRLEKIQSREKEA